MAKYIDADLLVRKIRGQIRLENLNFAALGGGGQTFCINTLEWVLKQIDSLQQEQLEEPIPEDLEEAAEEYIKKGKYLPEGFVVRPAFIAGAKWQKEQMLKDAVEHYVVSEIGGRRIGPAIVHFDKNFIIGDKVRVIVLKKED